MRIRAQDSDITPGLHSPAPWSMGDSGRHVRLPNPSLYRMRHYSSNAVCRVQHVAVHGQTWPDLARLCRVLLCTVHVHFQLSMAVGIVLHTAGAGSLSTVHPLISHLVVEYRRFGCASRRKCSIDLSPNDLQYCTFAHLPAS